MESVEVAKIKPGQSVTLTIGDAEVILTKLEGARQFRMEDWYVEEREVYLVEDEIQEEELLHYTFEDYGTDKETIMRMDEGKFGQEKRVWNFLARPIEGIEMEEEEEEEEEEEGAE
ncbi:hypothetical protein [Candidatus Magnetaquicoccus inordinatus]|uniref:hypothetical protein n=1 Tax=Candidatus Magnetaquicoccus inordinatus TaxID=2496818 RepID=UPI00102B11BC|nr:hypothetical protein [Candidatus Magnetaquicoccus inordinatus]